MWLKIVLASTLIMTASTGHADEFYREVGGWSVFRSEGSESCLMRMEYEGPGNTEAGILVRLDEELEPRYILVVTNENWSAEEDKKYELDIYLDDEAYSANARGTTIGDKKGFSVFVGRDFVQDFAATNWMEIFLGETRVDDLSLKGTSAALNALDICFAPVIKEKRRFGHIAKDPFKDN